MTCVACLAAICLAGCASVGGTGADSWPKVIAERLTYNQPVFRPLGTILFVHDSTALGTEAKAFLDTVARRLERRPQDRVRLDGHASSVGSAAYNRTLAMRRADAVKAELVARGIAAERITAVSLGESEPTGLGQAADRRVEVILIRAARQPTQKPRP